MKTELTRREKETWDIYSRAKAKDPNIMNRDIFGSEALAKNASVSLSKARRKLAAQGIPTDFSGTTQRGPYKPRKLPMMVTMQAAPEPSKLYCVIGSPDAIAQLIREMK